MSKIYEALLRAEQDRADLGQDKGESTDSAYATAVAEPPAPVSVPLPGEPAEYGFPTLRGRNVEQLQPAIETVVPTPAAPFEVLAVTDAQPGSTAQKLEGRPTVWHPDAPRLPALQSRGSQVEQFRSLRSKLFEFRDLNKLKSVLVSSGLPAEGKSFVTTNLAITFARHKSSRVLLIDGDLRRSSQHKALGAPNEPGLAEYLSGKATLADILQAGKADAEGSSLQGGLSNLSFIPAGDAGDKAADLSGSPRFAELMELVVPHFDWIVADSSPVNLVTDGVNLARSCDGVLLIARGGVTKFESAQRALSELKASKILGMVLNAVADPPTADGYYGYDNYDSLKES